MSVIFTEIALVIHSVFMYTFEGIVNLQIPETLNTTSQIN